MRHTVINVCDSGSMTMDRNYHILDVRSKAYYDGYKAYQSWVITCLDRPENPYSNIDYHGENIDHQDWWQGWEDASFDEC